MLSDPSESQNVSQFLSELSSVVIMPMEVKGASRIMPCEGHLLLHRLDWDQLYWGTTAARYWLCFG